MPKISKQQKKPYKGLLNKPIRIAKAFPSQPSILGGDNSIAGQRAYKLKAFNRLLEISNYIEEQQKKKLQALMIHYGISGQQEDAWEKLAYELAKNHVPGFKTETQSEAGRPEIWNPLLLAKLYLDVEQLISKKNLSISAACNVLIKKQPWSSLSSIKTSKALQNHYYEAKDSPFIQTYINMESGFQDQFFDDYKDMIDKIYQKI